MNFSEFEQLLDTKKSLYPIWFEIPADRTATEEDIIEAQNDLELRLPAEYSQFLQQHGGGYFALGIVYSLDRDSDFNLARINRQHPLIGKCHLLFSENGCGDFYGFRIENNQCLAEVYFFDHETQAWQQTGYPELFSFLAEVALSI
ncbi:SMI1/KNR4 family protein [Pseudomonas protegens]|uniref:SMI1/KNR4 family protein n=1 Tax=Pseudomonas protegens TaxID=380021 RepID=UPI00320A1863